MSSMRQCRVLLCREYYMLGKTSIPETVNARGLPGQVPGDNDMYRELFRHLERRSPRAICLLLSET